MNREYTRFLSIDLTKKCTNFCRFCVVCGTRHLTPDQKFDDIVSFLKEYREKGFNKINLHGGEPQLYNKFNQLITLINELQFEEITIQTNGLRLKDKDFISNLIAKKVGLFVVSYHDCIRENHNFLVNNQSSFDEVEEGIQNVLSLGGQVRTNTVLVKSNYNHVKQIVDRVYELGVRKINISSLNPWWMMVNASQELFNELCPSYTVMAPYIRDMLDSYKHRDVKITLEGFPYCFLPGYDEFNLYSVDRDIFMLSENNFRLNYESYATSDLREKKEDCKQCTKFDACGGIWKGYTAYYGFNEFQPILEEASTEKV